MTMIRVFTASTVLAVALSAGAQQPSQPELRIDSANRTLTVTANENVDVEPDVAILHIGFETEPTDAKSAYAAGARTSNTIVDALKQAGIPESSIRSESQYLQPDYTPKSHKFKLAQRWTVRTSPQRAAEILDVAVNAGANSVGEIDWTVKDEAALDEQALDKAATRAKEIAAVLAKDMGVRLGALIHVSNQLSAPAYPRPMVRALAMTAQAESAPPLAIEPQKVSRNASVYAVFAIE